MTSTLYLDEPIANDRSSVDCEEVRIVGDVAWATPEGGGQEVVVPMGNVCGIECDSVQQRVEELESPGGRFTEVVTDIS